MKQWCKLCRALPAALWYGVIWNFSAQTAAVSGDLSDRLLWRMLAAVSPAFAAADGAVQSASVELLSFFERKAAHMFLYFTLVLLVWLALGPWVRGKRRQMPLAAVLTAVLAGLDEYHQTFVPGRSGEVRDVCVDMTGALIALALALVLLWVDRCRRQGGTGWWALAAIPLCTLAALWIAIVPPAWAQGVLAWAAERFCPAFPAGDVAALAPVAREAVLAVFSGVLGFAGALLAALTGKRAASALTGSLLLVLTAGCSASVVFQQSALVGLAALGFAVGAALWGLYAAARRTFAKVA